MVVPETRSSLCRQLICWWRSHSLEELKRSQKNWLWSPNEENVAQQAAETERISAKLLEEPEERRAKGGSSIDPQKLQRRTRTPGATGDLL